MSNSSMTGQGDTGSEAYQWNSYQKEVMPPLSSEKSLPQSPKSEATSADDVMYVPEKAKYDLDYFMQLLEKF